MLKLKALIIAGLLVGSPALAQQSAPAMSASGKKIVQDYMQKRSADIGPLLQKKRALQNQFDGLLTPKTYDEAKLEATMSEMRTVEGQLFDAMGSTMLALLKSLPAADRAVFMQSLTKQPNAAKPSGPGR